MLKTMSVAAMLLVMVAVGGYFSGSGGGSGNVFAAMIDRINEIRSVRFDMESEPDKAGDIPGFRTTFTLMPPWTRQDMMFKGRRVVGISNSEQHKTLMLFEDAKHFTLGESNNAVAGREKGNVVDAMRQLPKEGAENLGKEQVDGVDASKFRYGNKGDYYTVWIDPASELPIRVVMTDTLDPSTSTYKVVYSKFKWNIPVDAGLFTLAPPAGYTLSPNARK